MNEPIICQPAMTYPKYTSLKEITDENKLNAIIAENMVDLFSYQEVNVDFEKIALFCFAQAYHICRQMIKESTVPIWRLPDYFKSADYNSNDKDFNKIVKIMTITIVIIFTEHFNKSWQKKNEKFITKLSNSIKQLYLSRETITMPGGTEILSPLGPEPMCNHIFRTLHHNTNIDYEIPFQFFLSQSKHRENTPDTNDKRITKLEDEVNELKNNIDITKEDIDNIFQDDDTANSQKANNDNAEKIKSLKEQLAKEKSKNKKLKEEVNHLKKEQKKEKAKKKSEPTEEQDVEMLTELEGVPILKLLWYLMKLDGANVEGHGKKKPARSIMSTLSKIPFDTTKQIWNKENTPVTRQEDLLIKMNHWMEAIGMKFKF